MIDNSFTESYFRLETPLETNLEQAYIDREGKLILTTGIIETETFQLDRAIDPANSGQPVNINLIVDQITMFSTNPDVQNYLPLKIGIDDKQVEFDQPILTEQRDYKIIKRQSINNPVLKTRRYTNQIATHIDSTYTTAEVVASAFSGDVLYQVLTESAFLDFITTTTGMLTKVSSVSSVITGQFLRLEANEFNVFVFYAVGNVLYIKSLVDNTVFTNSVIQVDNFLGCFLFRDLLYLVYRNISTDKAEFIIYTKTNGVYQFYNPNIVLDIDLFLATDIIVGNLHASYVLMCSEPISPEVFVLYFNIKNRGVEEFDDGALFLESSGDDLDLLHGGGDNLSLPIVNLFKSTVDGNSRTIFWHRFRGPPTAGVQDWDSIVEFTTTLARGSIYRNFAVYTLIEGGVILCNLDSGELSRWYLNNIEPDAPMINSLITYASGCLSDNYLGFNFNPLNNSTIFSYCYQNNRPLKDVYRLNQNYDERPFSYQVENKQINISFSLPNGAPLIDLEIFKLLIDFRIRYTKQKTRHNPMVPNTDSKNKNKKEPRAIKRGTTQSQVEDILGYVNEDFSISDYLGIYLPSNIDDFNPSESRDGRKPNGSAIDTI